MLVHSYIYYELDDSIISDAQWSKWAVELAELQKKYPEESAEVEDYEQFKDWDGSSGAFLNFGEDVKTVAQILLASRYVNQNIKSIKSINKKSNFVEKLQNQPLKSLNSQKSVKSNTRSLF